MSELLEDNAAWQQAMKHKWELNRSIDALNEENSHLAACAVWDVVDSLLVTLLSQRKVENVNLESLAKFIRSSWVDPTDASTEAGPEQHRGLNYEGHHRHRRSNAAP